MVTPKKIKVLMVYPELPPSFWSFEEAVKLMNVRSTMPPLGPATVAAMLSKSWADRFEILPIVDINVESLGDGVILNADVVMISAMIVQKDSLRKLIDRVKRLGKIVVVGGPYATAYSEDVLAMGADHLVLGEAELTLAPFIEDLLAGKARKIYDEKSVIADTTVPLTEGKPLLANTPVPRFDLLKLPLYSSVAVQFSRGCPFDCEFCDITVLFGRKTRTKPPAQMIAELEAIYTTGYRGPVFFVDDNLIGNKSAIREFLPVLKAWWKKRKYPFSFGTQVSVDLANPNMKDVRERMIDAGFTYIFVGIESTNPEVLAEMNKGQNKGDIDEKVKVLQKAGFEVSAGLFVGSDKERPTVFADTLSFLQKNGIIAAMVGFLGAVRGTRFYDRMVTDGRLRAETSGNNTYEFGFNFKPMLDEKILTEGYVNLLEKLYSSKSYYERCRILQHRRGKHRRDRTNGTWFRATCKVFWRNAIKKPDPAFIKYMLDTILTSPSNIPQAVTHAVKFEHFKQITEAAVSAHRYKARAETLLKRFGRRAAKLRGDTDVRLQKLAALKRRYRAKAVKHYWALDPHFRANAKKALVELRRRLRECAEQYQRRWQGLAAPS